MTPRIKNIIKTHLKSYLEKNTEQKIKDKQLCMCPFKCSNKPTASFLHHVLTCHNCNFSGDIFSLVKKQKGFDKEEDVAEYLIHFLKIEIEDNVDELLSFYQKMGWALIPLASGLKVPPEGFAWRDKVYKNPVVWKEWIDRGWGVAVVLGKDSNVVLVEFDDNETYKKFENKMVVTLHQSTKRGTGHFYYKYNSMFVKTLNQVLKKDKLNLELRTEGAYAVIAPTPTDGEVRKWNSEPIVEMGNELKTFFQSYYDKNVEELNPDQEIQKAIDTEKIGVVDLSNRRNDTFISLGGILRKKLNKDQTEYALSIISNNLIDKPVPKHELKAIMGQINKYSTYDKKELAKIVLDRLEIVGTGSAFTLAKSLSYEQKDVEEVLNYLEKEQKVISVKGERFRRLEQAEWGQGYDNLSVPLDYEVPFFSKYATLDQGSMIIIGGKTGKGKTHLVGNIIKKFADKKEIDSIDLISTEADSKIGKVLQTLKIPHHFIYQPKKFYKHPTEIELRDNKVTIIDWIRPKDGDYAGTDSTFEHFENQLKRHKGLLIALVQIRPSNGDFFAKDLMEFYGAYVCKFYHPNPSDLLHPIIESTKIRDSKTGYDKITIALEFNRETKVLLEK